MDCVTYVICNNMPHDCKKVFIFSQVLISPNEGEAFWVHDGSVRLGTLRNGLCNPWAFQ